MYSYTQQYVKLNIWRRGLKRAAAEQCNRMSTTILTTSDYECTVCHISLDRVRMNYGALSCLSCRAFFRRICTKERIEVGICKEKNNCKISFIDRVSCPPCRFQKCLR